MFSSIEFSVVEQKLQYLHLFPKLGSPLGLSCFSKLLEKSPLGLNISNSGHIVYVHRVITMYVKCFDFIPYFWNQGGGVKKSEDYKPFQIGDGVKLQVSLAALNSSAFFYFTVLGDCFHCGKEFVLSFPLSLDSSFTNEKSIKLRETSQQLMVDMKKNAVRKQAVSEKTGPVEYDEFWPSKSKPIIDEIDRVLAKHYGLTDEELDFIINNDIKYRMGRDNQEE